jgi:RecQ-mediated genome instability protein 1
VLDVENLSRSRWEQVEELEALERGEGTRGREVVRVEATPAGGNEDVGVVVAGGGDKATHRLVLQDCAGQRVFAVELGRVERVGVGRTSIGEKMMLKKGTKIARGVVLLEPEMCQVIGGKVEEWHREWVKERLGKLKGAVEGRSE